MSAFVPSLRTDLEKRPEPSATNEALIRVEHAETSSRTAEGPSKVTEKPHQSRDENKSLFLAPEMGSHISER